MTRIDLRGLDLNLLVVLERVLARESVGAAATDLGLSQPAVSRSLQRLRDALGDPLLMRVGHEMVPTERAKALAGPVAFALEAARRVFEPPDAFVPALAGGTLVIAMGDEAQVSLGDAIFAGVWAACPGVDLRVTALSAATVEQGRRGEIDLAIAPDLRGLPLIAGAPDTSEYVHRSLYTRRFVVAEAAGRSGAPMDLERWLAASHVIVSFEAGGRGFVDELLEARGLRRRVAASVTSFMAAARLVAATDLVCVIPEEVAWTVGVPLTVHPSPLPLPSIPIQMLWHPRLASERRHRFLRDRVAEAVGARAAAWAN